VVVVPIPYVTHSPDEEGRHTLPRLPGSGPSTRGVLDWMMHGYRVLRYDVEIFFLTFMPGLWIPLHIWVMACLSLVTAVTWLTIYKQYFYEEDRSTSLERWSLQLGNLHKSREAIEKASKVHHADLVFVFPHPATDEFDATQSLNPDKIRRLVMCDDDAQFENIFPRVYALASPSGLASCGVSLPAKGFRDRRNLPPAALTEGASSSTSTAPLPSSEQLLSRGTGRQQPGTTSGGSAEAGKQDPTSSMGFRRFRHSTSRSMLSQPTKASVRTALLQDF
jgi:hypothetical protein